MASLLIFGIPLSTALNKNENYSSINSLHNLEQKNNFKTYSFGEVTPELLWDYKGKIESISESENIILPRENSFGLLIMNDDVKYVTTQLEQNYSFMFLETYDLNTGSKSKERLIRQLYLISKK